MPLKSLKSWDALAKARAPSWFNVEKAREIQKMLASMVIASDVIPLEKLRYVAGLDVAYVGDVAVSAAVLVDRESRAVVEYSIAEVKVTFPYVPTLLSFREMKPMITALRKLSREPDAVLVDGHGISHPYRLGIAAHIGVCIKKPTIGVAKSLLYGEVREVGGRRLVIDPLRGDVIAAELQTCGKPIYVSIGNMISLESAIKLVEELTPKCSKLPLPLKAAHNIATRERNRIKRAHR